MATTQTTSLAPEFGAALSLPGASAVAVVPETTATESLTVDQTDLGKSINYTIVVQLPIPFFNLNLDINLLGDFVLPALTKIGVPQAITKFMTQAQDFISNVMEDAYDLVSAVPEATVTILFKIGPAIILNVRLVAEKQPVEIALPSFQLGLPNIGADVNLALTIPFPAPPPVSIRVPIPYPVVRATPILGITGGNVGANVGGVAGLGSTASIGGVASGGISSAGAAGSLGGISPIELPSATVGNETVGGVIPGFVLPSGAAVSESIADTTSFGVSSGVVLPPI